MFNPTRTVGDGVMIECLVSLWQLTVFFCFPHSWVHTERRTWSVFISGMEHGDIHITGLMCPKRLGLPGTRQGVQFNQVRGTLRLKIYVWFIWNLGWPEHPVFLFALAGNSVGEKILPVATEQTESQLYSLVLGLHCQASSQYFLGVLWRATVHPQPCQISI